MIGMLLEAVVLAFMVGGIIGALTALHLSHAKKVPVRIQADNHLRQGRRR